jgi:hypothetical protein
VWVRTPPVTKDRTVEIIHDQSSAKTIYGAGRILGSNSSQ